MSLKFKRYATQIQAFDNAEKMMLRAVLFSFGALAVWYVIILGTIVFNISERKTAEAKVRALSSEVSDLELEYLALSNSIDLNLSYSMGFKEISAKFATRKSLDALGMNSERGVLTINKVKGEI
ncbi:MAG: hypothetical protein KBD17_00410 [Candidatus Pacebacteria bacterium]|jgi:hypothetical protein|nr:hypothetical protein [Candidatus Paceibacterota bacterium]